MKYVLLLLCVLGIVVSSLALREHYRTEGFAPCDINEKWDCGIVNQSPYAIPFFVNVDRKSTRLNSSHITISYAVFCLKKKKNYIRNQAIISTSKSIDTSYMRKMT